MIRVPGMQCLVPGTRNNRKPCESRRVPGVPGVPGLCARVRVGTHALALAHIRRTISRVYTQGTPGTPGTTLAAQAIPLFRVPGTQKTNPEHAAMTTKPGNLRTDMPTVAGWIDQLRDAFGAEAINAAIRAGMNGQPTFYAEENGRAVGTKSQGNGVTLAETVIGPLVATAQTAGAKK